jgi:hypothetical protein
MKPSLADRIGKSPLAQLADQQRFFVRDFGVALTAIYNEGKRPAALVTTDPADLPKFPTG